MTTVHVISRALAVLFSLLVFCHQALALNILLTNDDGYDTYGIRALKTALEAENHSVYLVAPAKNQSGKSGSISINHQQSIQYQAHDDRIWAVEGTPVDAVMAGLYGLTPSELAEGEQIDLVISGANEGENLSRFTNQSGTVGAAMFAVRAGIPAIAISVGMDFNSQMALQEAQKSGNETALQTIKQRVQANNQDGAERAAKLLMTVLKTLGNEGLPAGLALNINVPNGAIEAQGIRLTRSDNTLPYSLKLKPLKAGELAMDHAMNKTLIAAYMGRPVPPEVYTPNLNSESEAFVYGFTSIAIFSGNFDTAMTAGLTESSRQLACRFQSIATVEIYNCDKGQ